MPSPPPPRRLSRSSIDLRDLELQHEKLSHTDSAPSIGGLDKYLKSSDSEPLHFQQQLQQQLKFQEQIQQQYYLGTNQPESKAKQLRQNSLKKLNNFLQPFLFPGPHRRDTTGEKEAQCFVGDTEGTANATETATDAEEEQRLKHDESEGEEEERNDSDVLETPTQSDNFYINFYNEKIALGPARGQYAKIPSHRGGGALSESDFLTIRDIQSEINSVDNPWKDGEKESRAKKGLAIPNRCGRRRSSSCEDLRVGKSLLRDAGNEAKFSVKDGEEFAREEKEANVLLWKNFGNKSRFGSTLKKFNSSSRLLVGSLFGERSSSAKNRIFKSNRNTMWSMDETSSACKEHCGESDERIRCDGDVDGGREGEESANQLTIKCSDEELGCPEGELIEGLICEADKIGMREEGEQVENANESILVVQHKRGREAQRMRVFSDGNFESDNQLERKKTRPRVMSEGHESSSTRELSLVHNAKATNTTSTSTSTNDTPDILIGLVNLDSGKQSPEEERAEKEPPKNVDNSSEKLTLQKARLNVAGDEQQKYVDKRTTTNEGLSLVDQELSRALSNVTSVGETAKPLATKPEIVMDSTVEEGKVGDSEMLSIANPSYKSPSALLKRDGNGMRLRQASVVTYDVNVINFGGPDEFSASDNFNYHGNGSFSSAAGQSNLHNGRPSTSSASKCRVNQTQIPETLINPRTSTERCLQFHSLFLFNCPLLEY